MNKTYGNRAESEFHATQLNGEIAYENAPSALERTIFLQKGRYRFSISTAVMAQPDQRSDRLGQIEDILSSFTLLPAGSVAFGSNRY
jgi:hypothetical protein